MMVKVYGLPNCDTVKKSISWLKENHISFKFHDFKKEEVPTDKLQDWVTASSIEKVLNKKSTAFRNLSTEEQEKTSLVKEAILLMQANPNLIKRPVVEIAGTVLHGFSVEEYKKAFDKN